jgi:hypothetical protein
MATRRADGIRSGGNADRLGNAAAAELDGAYTHTNAWPAD